MKRGKPERRTPLRRGKPVKPVSDRRRQENAQRRMTMLDRYGRYPDCAAGPILRTITGAPTCAGKAVDAHELLSRARGGSITNPENIIPVCRPCHRYITENPTAAAAAGLARSRWR